MNSVIETINRYKAKTAGVLKSQQKAQIPRLEDQIECIVQSYTINNQRVLVNQAYNVCFRLRYLKWGTASKRTIDTYLDYKKSNGSYSEFVHMTGLEYTMRELVNNRIIRPFMLFIDGVMIPWDILYLHISRDICYLTVKTNMHKNNSGVLYLDEKFGNLIRNPRFAQIVDLPEYVSFESYYSTMNPDKRPDPDEIIFGFDSDGKYTRNLDPDAGSVMDYVYYTRPNRVAFNDGVPTEFPPRMYMTPFHARIGVSAIPILGDISDIKLSSENVFLFTNGILTTGEIPTLKIAKDTDIELDIEIKGTYASMNDVNNDTSLVPETGDYVRVGDDYYRFSGTRWMFAGNYIRTYVSGVSLEDVEIETPIAENPAIRFDSTLLTIGDGTNRNADLYNILVFMDRKYDASIDAITKFNTAELSEVVHDINMGGTEPVWFDDASEPFQFEMDQKKLYSDNVADAIKYMMSYDSSLFNGVIYGKSKLDVEEKTTEWIQAYTSDQGTLIVPRRVYDGNDEYLVLFVNGMIYKHMSVSRQMSNKFIVPIQGINTGDKIELWRFKNVNNNTYDIVVDEADGYREYSPDIINEDMVLFVHQAENEAFDLSEGTLQSFEVEYTLEKDASGKIKIILNNPFYYDQPLTVAYRNRFVNSTYYAVEDKPEFAINLGSSFKYCNDPKRYNIFYNGRRIDPSRYRLAIPNSPTLPFIQFKLYMSIPVVKGDRVDVIYSPIQFEDVVIYDTIATTGDIVVEKELLDYAMNPYLYMVWVNGKKVPASSIKVIDSSHLRIMSDEKSVHYVAITKQIPSVEEIAEAFKENESLWDSVASQLTNEEIERFFGLPEGSITDSEESIISGAVPTKSVMYELVREEYLNSFRVDATQPFIYDYDDKSIVNTDGALELDGELVGEIDVMDADIGPDGNPNSGDNIEEIDRDPLSENVE